MNQIPSPEEILSSNDRGDDMQRRVRYQNIRAASYALALLREDSAWEYLYCEQHEDILVKRKDNKYIGIQVKTKERGMFTANEEPILDSLKHFIEHENKFPGNFSKYILATNCGFSENSDLQSLLDQVHQDIDTTSKSKLVKNLCNGQRYDRDLVLQVLKKIELPTGLPGLDDAEARFKDELSKLPGVGLQRVDKLQKLTDQLIYRIENAANLKHSLQHPSYYDLLDNSADVKQQAIIKGKQITKDILLQIFREAGFDLSLQPRQIDWSEVCRKTLPTSLSANPLLSGDGVSLEITEIVPLELVERKQTPVVNQDVAPDSFHQSQKEQEQELAITYQQFFEESLSSCTSLNNGGKGITIIGEPGAGKTTLLYAIADWITKRGELPVFVSLQALGNDETLEDYLLGTCLKKATGQHRVSETLQDNLVSQFYSGKVWLLLDGVDERAWSSNSLSQLGNELGGWIGKAKVVLTCRVNVWEANRNALRSTFEVYRSKGFGDEEVLQFIQKFFAKAEQPELGTALGQELETAPPRLQDLIRNPLLLTLLCRTWKRRQGTLPNTKAELYQGFVATYYDWKDRPQVPEEKRPLLEKGLGEVAKKALDQESFRFRLQESFLRRELNQFDPVLFKLACDSGWLNKVGMAAENPDESVYAFFHPTFQEYFAALAIDNHQFLLHHVPEDPQQGTYRIFEPQWKEVLMLWLGRNHNDLVSEKERLLNLLTDFDDGCEKVDLYGYRLRFLAAIALSEFSRFDRARVLVENVFARGLSEIETFNNPIKASARATLKEMDSEVYCDFLIDLIQSENTHVQHDSAKLIGELQLGSGNQKISEALTTLVNTTEFKDTRYYALCSLLKIEPKNLFVINKLIEIINSYSLEIHIPMISIIQAISLAQADIEKLADSLENLIRNLCYRQEICFLHHERYTVQIAARNLLKFRPDSEIAMSVLNLISEQKLGFEDLWTNPVQEWHQDLLQSLSQFQISIDSGVIKVIERLLEIMLHDEDEKKRARAAWCLESIMEDEELSGSKKSYAQLIPKLKYCYKYSPDRSVNQIPLISVGTQHPVIAFRNVLWLISQHLDYPTFHKAWNSDITL